MHRWLVPLIVIVLLFGPGIAADEPVLIRDETLRARVESRLAQQRRLARHREKALFGVLIFAIALRKSEQEPGARAV